MQRRIPSLKRLSVAATLGKVARGTAVAAISGYQKFISPHKGFSCAHRVLYGSESCSQYFKRVIAEEGIGMAIANAKGRFQECHDANEILKERRAKCQAKQKYYATRYERQVNSVVAETGSEENEPPESEDSQRTEEQNSRPKLGGSQWSAKRRASQVQNNQNNSNNNCNNCDAPDCYDCFHCADVLNILPDDFSDKLNCDNPLESIDCSGCNCSNFNCGDADCLSGMDCSGLDCSGLDCGGCSW
ncbi:MAG: hypothetical protein DCE90_06050 [Pseudanabaena sp.]|nr:MAG: hypothetical protein DCE90_06050 [Pseudanabaena sp.]